MIEVALREEGVDRNWTSYDINSENRAVALREEGADRNSRGHPTTANAPAVALREEGVDRNHSSCCDGCALLSRPPRGGRG